MAVLRSAGFFCRLQSSKFFAWCNIYEKKKNSNRYKMSSEPTAKLVIPKRADCVYTSCFCEENIWYLAKSILEANKSVSDMKCYVIFMSNNKKCVHLWRQSSKHYEDGLMFWDYHVFLILEHKDETLVFDMDSTLSFPVPFSQFNKEAVRNDFNEIQSKRFFRIVEAEKFLELFSSDRSHMLEGDHWMSPPPAYPPILNEDEEHNLESFISMESSNEFGQVLNLEEFKARFS